MPNNQEFLARRGLTLTRGVLRRLKEVGIFARSQVSLEHQHLARRYVVRGIESGGAVKDLGRYVTFSGAEGEPLPYLHPIDAIGVNGVHAVVVAPVLVRIELFRAGRTCQLLITKHEPAKAENGRRPALENRVLFRGVNGLVGLDLLRAGSDLDGRPVMPEFWSRAAFRAKVKTPLEYVVSAARASNADLVGAGRPTAAYFARARCRWVRTVVGAM